MGRSVFIPSFLPDGPHILPCHATGGNPWRISATRNNRHKIKLFNFDGTRHRIIYKAEAEYLLEFRHAQEFCRHCGRSRAKSRCPGRKEHDIILKLIEPEKHDKNSPACISYSEMLANAGIAESQGAIRRAQEKVAAWCEVGIPRMRAACNGD